RFVEDVNLANVITAGHVMKRPESVTVDKGPRVALQLMRDEGISTVYIVGRQKKLLGYVTPDQAQEASKQSKSLEDVMTRDVGTVSADTLLTDLFEPMADAKAPLAVVDDEGRLDGIVVRGAVVGALAGSDEALSENGVTTDG